MYGPVTQTTLQKFSSELMEYFVYAVFCYASDIQEVGLAIVQIHNSALKAKILTICALFIWDQDENIRSLFVN